ncbi:hypothetical protein [Kitasatospora mediocidica]|uniref:hypothetical protein n=1 Tax=Kitasatospora mediocidica TaxID=58352 RepID=UPI000569FF3C|nr:hypothetical protein [Kitasatospora mediocidica]
MTPTSNDAESAVAEPGAEAAPPGKPAPPGPATPQRALRPAGSGRPGRLGRLGRLARRVPAHWRLPLAVAVGTELILLLWWAAFYPGLTSYDSAMYVSQVTIGPWSSDHSVLYDAMIWLVLHIPGKLALLTLAQTFAAAATLAYLCVALRGLGCRGRWTAPIALLLAAAPPTGAFVLFIWKDVPFTLCSLVVFAATVRLIALRPTEAARPTGAARGTAAPRGDWWALGLALLGLGLFRNNGLGVALVAGLAVAIAVPGRRVVLTALTTASVGVSLACQLFLYPALGIQQPSVSSVFSLNYHDIAVVYANAPESFTAQEKAVMAEVTPLTEWTAGGSNCYVSDQFVSNWQFNRTAAEKVNSQLTDIWTHALKTRPDLVLQARICRGDIAWSPFPGPPALSGDTWIAYPGVAPQDLYGLAAPGTPMASDPYRLALYSHPVSQRLRTVAATWYNAFRVPQLDWIVYRGATWCYLAYAAIAFYVGRRRMRAVYALVGVPLAYQLTVLAANPAPLYRYMVGPLFIGPFCLALIPALRGYEQPHEDGGDRERDRDAGS